MASCYDIRVELFKMWIFLFWFLKASIVNGYIQEYCSTDNFSPKCGTNEVIIMSHGLYGRMQLGVCRTTEYGLGCKTNVIGHLDKMCSNKQQCDIDVHRDFVSLSDECPIDVVSYLEADYKCEQVLQIQSSECRSTSSKIEVTSRISVSSAILSESNCGSSSITFTARPGQQLNISIVDFNYVDHKNNQRSCVNYLELQDGERIEPVCAGSYQRKGHVMVSRGQEVTAVFHIQDPRNQRFIISFEAIGCGDISPPEGTWVRRDGDSTTLGCHSGKHSWTLTCENNQWVGAVGSCGTGLSIEKTVEQPVKRKTNIAFGMIVFAFCSVLLLICSTSFSIGVCVFTKRNRKEDSAVRYIKQTLPLMAHARQHPITQLPQNQINIQQQHLNNQGNPRTSGAETAPNCLAENNKVEKATDPTYCNTMHSQTDSVYSDSVKYYVLENLQGNS